MAEFFDYNPDTGVTYSTDFDELTGTMYVHSSQDLTPLIERNKLYKTHNANDKVMGVEFFRYASVPPTVVVSLKRRGYNLFTKDQSELLKIRNILQTEYPDLITTNKKIYIPKKSKETNEPQGAVGSSEVVS